MTKKEAVLTYFDRKGEEDGTTYYVIGEGYGCLYNDEETITLIQIDEDGYILAGSDKNEPTEFAESDWDLVSIHGMTEVLGATK